MIDEKTETQEYKRNEKQKGTEYRMYKVKQNIVKNKIEPRWKEPEIK